MNASGLLTELVNLPLSSNQMRLWIISMQDKSNPAYNIQLAYHFEGKIDRDLLEQSLEILFMRQHTMFSVFRYDGSEPFIDIVPRKVELNFKDFTTQTTLGREALMSFAGEDSRVPYDLENGPLYRLYLLKENDRSYFFYATIHHLIFRWIYQKTLCAGTELDI